MIRYLIGLLPSAFSWLLAAETPGILTAADYEPHRFQEWTVHVEKSLADHPRRAAALALLESKLGEVEKLLSPPVLLELRKVPFWLSDNAAPGACYHPSANWLKSNKRVVEMARSIEIQNIRHFIDWSDTQPMMILHELAHAWHHRVLANGYENTEIMAAFKHAMDNGSYASVRHADGSSQKHYATSNAMEYFAECTEAYFGRNDFEPFDREELKKFDPAGHALVEKLWQIEK